MKRQTLPSNWSREHPKTAVKASRSTPSIFGISSACRHLEIVLMCLSRPVSRFSSSATSSLVSFFSAINWRIFQAIAILTQTISNPSIHPFTQSLSSILVIPHYFWCKIEGITNQKPLVPWKVLSGLRPNRRQLMIVAESFVSTKIQQYWCEYTALNVNSAKTLSIAFGMGGDR